MIVLPHAHPPAADLRSGGRFLLSIAVAQRRHLALSTAVGVGFMLSEATGPILLGRAIDVGILGRDLGALLIGCLFMLAAGLVTALLGTLLHRVTVTSWLLAALGTQQLVGWHVTDHGMAVAASTTTGEVVETSGSDAAKVGYLFETVPRAMGAFITYPAVSIFVLSLDTIAGLWVTIGLPVITVVLALVLRPMQSRERAQRKAVGELTALGADIAAGLRVLRGIGGERQFLQRYRAGSQEVRFRGTRVARGWGAFETAQVCLSGMFVVVLIYLGARGVLAGRLTGGQLVMLYGSAAYLRTPLDAANEFFFHLIGGRVAAERVVRLLRHQDDGSAASGPASEPASGSASAPGADLVDEATGVRLQRGLLTALVSSDPEDATAVVMRLALAAVPGQRIQLSEAEPRLFSGTFREQVDPAGEHDDKAVLAALASADAMDVLAAQPDGLGTQVEERGRGFSGGQRQRLALARALLAGADVLLLIEPTSAVDAHTEARVAVSMRAARRGRTTLVTTASPLLLQECDQVLLLAGRRLAARGSHHELMATSPEYRDVVAREPQEVER